MAVISIQTFSITPQILSHPEFTIKLFIDKVSKHPKFLPRFILTLEFGDEQGSCLINV